MAIDTEKYQQVILHLLERANNGHLGLTKLHKMLYYIDFDHFERNGESITGDVYIKQPYGPVPQNARTLLHQMERQGLITISREQIINYARYVFKPLVHSEPGVLHSSEMETVDRVIQRWADHTTNEIVAATHGEAPWRAVKDWEEIPYGLAYYRRSTDISDPESDEDASLPPWAADD